MGRVTEVFLDIETDWSRSITVIGFASSLTGVVQLTGTEITRTRLLKILPSQGRLFTFNGHCFDLPCIRSQLGIDLRERFDSHDLRFICARAGLSGGQKAVETRIGVRRELAGMDGRDALRLWAEYQRGDPGALRTLLRYNAEDLEGLRTIRRYVGVNKLAEI